MTAEEVEEDPEAYDCEACPYRAIQDALTDDDHVSLQVYHWLREPVVQALQLRDLVFDAFGLQVSRGEVWDLLERLKRIHAAVGVMAKEAEAKRKDQGESESSEDG